MYKKLLLGVVFILLTFLLLAGTVLADGTYVDNEGTCRIRWLAYDRKGDTVERASVPGSFSVIRNDSKIATTCSGTVPLGETYVYKNHIETRYTLAKMCGVFGCQTENLLVVSYANLPQEATITDPVTGVTYYTQDWTLRVTSNGNFHLDKVYFFP